MRLVGHGADRGLPARDGGGDPAFTRQQARQVFREIVQAELRNGPLCPRRRRHLIQYAAMLDLTPLDAGRIVTEVYHQNRSSREQPAVILPFPTPRQARMGPLRPGWPISLKLGLGLAAVFVVSQLLRYLG